MTTRERRKNRRFLPQLQTVVILRPYFTTLGNLIDIGRGGLSFLYLTPDGSRAGGSGLDILTIEKNDFYVGEVPCRVIYDLDHSITACFKNKRCGLAFEKLKPKEAALLDAFLRKHTAPP